VGRNLGGRSRIPNQSEGIAVIWKPGGMAVWLAVLLSAAIAACTFREPAGNFVSQQVTWFSYLNGDDIRAQCGDSMSDRYRLVYNADRQRHSRGYDIWDVREGAVMEQMVDRGIVFESGRPLDLALIGVPVRARAVLSPNEFAEFKALLQASGVFDPPPVGLRLNSRGHYWIVSGCREGRFFLTGFLHPSERFDQIQFIPFLETRDQTGVRFPILPPPARARFEQRCPRGRGTTLNNPRCFWIEIGEDGLVGLPRLE